MSGDRGEIYRIVWAVLLVVVVATYVTTGGIGISEFRSLSDEAKDRLSDTEKSEEQEESTNDEQSEQKETANSGPVNKTALRMAIHDKINEARKRNDLNVLTYNPQLEALAQKHSNDMAAQGYFSHTSPDGVSMSERYRAENIGCAGAENIWRGTSIFRDEENIAELVVDSWMNSQGHKENILGKHSAEGIGIAVGEYEGDRNLFVTQNFC